MNLLLIEDNPALGKVIDQGLTESGHRCEWVRTAAAGWAQIAAGHFDAILLDLMLPDVSGLELLQRIRDNGNQTPVIILTALGSVQERVAGLRAGADDYLVKPFELAELVARLEAVCRRTHLRPATVLTVGSLTLDLATRRVTRGGDEVDLTPTEFSILEFLMRHEGHVVTRAMLCEHLWEADWEGTTNVIEVHINRLRNKIDKGRDNSRIRTIRGRGYAIRSD